MIITNTSVGFERSLLAAESVICCSLNELISQLLRNTRQKAPGQTTEGKREVFLSCVTDAIVSVGGSYLAPGG